MRLNRREILEELVRLGIRNFSSLKKACREFEIFWDIIHACNGFVDTALCL
jgi:hypothetical protein